MPGGNVAEEGVGGRESDCAGKVKVVEAEVPESPDLLDQVGDKGGSGARWTCAPYARCGGGPCARA